MATAAGISQVIGLANAWVQLPNQACEELIFQRGGFDIAYSATPGNNFFHINPDLGALSVPVVNNANTVWIRAIGPVTFIWSSP
jgi:hypothetical protein